MRKQPIGKFPRVAKALLPVFPQVRTVSDALAGVNVAVTSHDRRGKPKSPQSCAMARACMREHQVDGAFIRLGTAYLVKGTHATRYLVPNTVAREIVSFDRHADFAPGDYRLKRVPPRLRLGTQPTNDNRGARKARPSRVHVVKRHRTINVRAS